MKLRYFWKNWNLRESYQWESVKTSTPLVVNLVYFTDYVRYINGVMDNHHLLDPLYQQSIHRLIK